MCFSHKTNEIKTPKFENFKEIIYFITNPTLQLLKSLPELCNDYSTIIVSCSYFKIIHSTDDGFCQLILKIVYISAVKNSHKKIEYKTSKKHISTFYRSCSLKNIRCIISIMIFWSPPWDENPFLSRPWDQNKNTKSQFTHTIAMITKSMFPLSN